MVCTSECGRAVSIPKRRQCYQDVQARSVSAQPASMPVPAGDLPCTCWANSPWPHAQMSGCQGLRTCGSCNFVCLEPVLEGHAEPEHFNITDLDGCTYNIGWTGFPF